jgi:uncharacterized SAM-binding protein YcdF (DUF218 family)
MKALFDPIAWLWFALLAICVIDALALRRSAKKGMHDKGDRKVARFRKRRLAVCGTLALGLFLLEVTALPTRLLAGLESQCIVTEAQAHGFDAVVVLGGGWSPPAGTPLPLEANDSFDRLLYGVDLARGHLNSRNPEIPIVIGGGGLGPDGKPTHPTDSEVAREWIGSLDLLPAARVIALPASANTRDEARHTAELVREHGWHDIALVTSAWHMPRALRTFQRAGLSATPFPADFRAHLSLANRQRHGPSYLPSLGTLTSLYYWLTETVAGCRDRLMN